MIVEASEVAMVEGRQSCEYPSTGALLYKVVKEEDEAGEKRVTVTHGAMTSRKKVKSSC